MTSLQTTPCPIGERDLTQRELELARNGSPVKELLPIENSAGCVLDELCFECPECRQPIADEDTRLCCTPWAMHHEIRGIALCRDCEVFVPLVMRWMSDGSMVGPHPQTGVWASINDAGRAKRAW